MKSFAQLAVEFAAESRKPPDMQTASLHDAEVWLAGLQSLLHHMKLAQRRETKQGVRAA